MSCHHNTLAAQVVAAARGKKLPVNEPIARCSCTCRPRSSADGGWAQTALLSSDAVRVTDPAFQRGVQFLLRTQYADGSWYVQTRAIPLQPHFESDFPYGRDQFISAAGTNWAARALVSVYMPGS